MSSDQPSFLFSSLGSKQPNTARKIHIRRLYDILHLCIQRQDWARAKRAWAILARCREVDWRTMWRTSVLLLGAGEPAEDEDTQANGDRVRFLTVMMRQHPDERESILKELVLRLIHAGMYRRAMEELDLYLPSYPYQDNPVLHTYAGLIALYLAQPANGMSSETTYGLDLLTATFDFDNYCGGSLGARNSCAEIEKDWDLTLARDAQAHFERARAIDPANVVADAFLCQLPGVAQVARDRHSPDSDDEKMDVDGTAHVRKRTRI